MESATDMSSPATSPSSASSSTIAHGRHVASNKLTKLASASPFVGSVPPHTQQTQSQLRPSESLPSSHWLNTTENLQELLNRLEIETKIKDGAENLLQVFDAKVKKADKEKKEAMRQQVERELVSSNQKINKLQDQVSAIQRRSANNWTHEPITNAIGTPRKPASLRKLKAQQSTDSLRPYVSASNYGDSSEYSFNNLRKSSESESLEEVSSSPLYAIISFLGQLEDTRDEIDIVRLSNQIVKILKRYPGLKFELDVDLFMKAVLSMLSTQFTTCVALGYKMLRYFLAPSVKETLQYMKILECHLIKSLSCESDRYLEKEQAFKLIREPITFPDAELWQTLGIVRAVVAIAEAPEDGFCTVALETVAEFLITIPTMTEKTYAIRVILNATIDGSHDSVICESLLLPFLYLFDSPNLRKMLLPETDVGIITSPLVETVSADNEERVRVSGILTSTLIKSWPGLLALCMHDFRTLRSIIDSLRVPMLHVRECILELFFDILGIDQCTVPETIFVHNGRWRPTFFPQDQAPEDQNTQTPADLDTARTNLLQHYRSLLLCLFLELDLTDALAVVIETDKSDGIVQKATILLAEVLIMSNQILPRSYGLSIQSLPRLFATASKFGDNHRFVATNVFAHIEWLNRIKVTQRTAPAMSNKNIASTDDPSSRERGQRQVAQVKIKMGMQIDGTHFRSMLMETQVLATKKFSAWKWDILAELLQGPLLNPKRLEETIKATKFMKRLLSFYRPFKYRFSQVKNTKPNQKYVKVGCLLINTLLANSEGVKYLLQNKLLRQIAECLAQLDPMSGITAQEPLLSQRRLKETLGGGYLAMIGTLSGHPEGVAMMSTWRMFNILHHLVELRSREDLIFQILANLNYAHDGHCRIILTKAATTGQRSVRLFATRHLGDLLMNKGSDKNYSSDDFEKWVLRILVTQLYDPQLEVCELAVHTLEKVCKQSSETLEYVVNLSPTLDHLTDIGAPMLLRFLSTSVGYQYLEQLDYVEKEMDDWFHGRNEDYVTFVEASLANALSTDFNNQSSQRKVFDGSCPPHFYGELSKTHEGNLLLKKKKHFETFVGVISEHGSEKNDKDVIMKVKSALWAIGNIGSSDRGAPFLERHSAIPRVVRIAERSAVASLRGTAYFVLGLISLTEAGSETLNGLGWGSVKTASGQLVGICIPKEIGNFLTIPSWSHTSSDSTMVRLEAAHLSKEEQEVTKLIADLSSHILANKAAAALSKMKLNRKGLFASRPLFEYVMHMLSNYHYRQAVRKFIVKLFDERFLEEDPIGWSADKPTPKQSGVSIVDMGS